MRTSCEEHGIIPIGRFERGWTEVRRASFQRLMDLTTPNSLMSGFLHGRASGLFHVGFP
jgi:hypothetical protein